MTEIITQLTPEQEILIPVYQEKWRKFALSTEPIDRDKAAEAVKAAYAVFGTKEPEILFFDSPYPATKTIVSHHLGNPLSKQLNCHLRIQPVMQLRSQLKLQVYQQLDRQLVCKLYRQLLREKLELSKQLHWQLAKNMSRQLRSKVDNVIQPEEWVFAGIFFDFCIAVLKCAYHRENWEAFQLIVKHCGWIYPFKKTCVVCNRPIKFSFYKPSRRHAKGKPAIQFADGSSMYPDYSRGMSSQFIY